MTVNYKLSVENVNDLMLSFLNLRVLFFVAFVIQHEPGVDFQNPILPIHDEHLGRVDSLNKKVALPV